MNKRHRATPRQRMKLVSGNMASWQKWCAMFERGVKIEPRRRACLVKKAAVLRKWVPVGSGSVRKSGKKIGTALGGSAKKPKKIRYRAGGLRFLNARSSL